MTAVERNFGEGGVYFPNAVVTTPLCCPSRASIFSGRYAHNHGVTSLDGTAFNPRKSLQYHLQQKLGYKTAISSNKYLQRVTNAPPYFDLVANRSGYYVNGVYQTDFVRKQAIRFLNTLEKSDAQPWFMQLGTIAPHEPAIVEIGYEDAPIPEWEDTPARTESDLSDKPSYVQDFNLRKEDSQAMRANQIRTLYSVDDMVSAVFNRLRQLGEARNTLAFFLTDNGYVWFDHGLKQKRHIYTDSVRTPFFVRWPGRLTAGSIDTRIVANIDVAATIYDILDYTPDNYVPDGRSVLGNSAREYILIEYWRELEAGIPTWKALWAPTWTYAEYPEDGFREYYGHDDPWQLDNGFTTNDPSSDADVLAAALQAAASCVGATCP